MKATTGRNSSAKSPLKQTGLPYARASPKQAVVIENSAVIVFPRTPEERARYRRPDGSKISSTQWRLYDLILQCPPGKVTTYGELSRLLNSCPRAVGSALRRNPFAPYVPCHRVVASNGFLAGFSGSWEKDGKSPLQLQKRKLLESEAVFFDSRGYLRGGDAVIWRGSEG